MPVIRANRDSVDDRFSVLGFTVRSESPIAEVVVTTDPKLTLQENRSQRSRENFYSSRAGGGIRVRRGEAVYLVPPDVLANFVGASKLYFGLATYPEGGRGKPDFVQAPTTGNLYVNLSGLSERGLRRISSRAIGSGGYGQGSGGSGDASLEWGGDWFSGTAPVVAPKPNGNGAASNGNTAAAAPPPAAAQAYSDGYDDNFWSAPPRRTPASRPLELVRDYDNDGLLSQIGFFIESAAWFAGVTDTSQHPHSAICQVRRPTSGGGDEEIATAFFIAPRLLLTAAHVVHGETELIIVPAKNDTAESRGRFRVKPADWQMHGSYLPSKNRDHDMAVIRVPAANAAGAGQYFDVVEELTQSRPEGVVVCGYSMQSNDSSTIARLVNATINPNRQHLHGGYIRSLPTDGTFDYDIQTLGGASGSPVYWIEDTTPPQAHMVGVHIAGRSDTTNLGCRITSEKLDWIRQQASKLGVSVALEAPAQAPVAMRPRAAAAARADTRPMSAVEAGQVDITLRVFIPSPAILAERPVVSNRAFGGDGRGFQASGGTSRAEIQARYVYSKPGQAHSFTVLSRSWGESTEYAVDDTQAVAGKPSWYRSIKPGAKPIARETLAVSDDNLSASLGGDSHQGIISVVEGSVVSGFHVAGALPLMFLSADIDANFYLHLKRDNDRMLVRLLGSHDEFPAYELYANGSLVYSYDPVARGGTPTGLIGTGDFDVEVDTQWLDVGPASDVRYIPVRILQASPQPFSVHWDTVQYLPQTSRASCWAAAAAMVVGWRDQQSIADTTVAQMVPVFNAYKNGLWPRERKQLADAWNLVAEPPASYTVEKWGQMLRDYGPLYIDMSWDTSGGGHARVLVGMESDGAADGSGTTMYMYDPWPDTPGKIKLTFQQFLELYEGRTQNVSTLEYQILHSISVPAGVSCVAAAPFSLSLTTATGSALRAARPRTARALENECYAVHWETVPYYPQPAGSNTCWAATAAMLVGWRDQRTVTQEDIAAKVPVIDAFMNGLAPQHRITLAEAWGLVAEPPACYTVEAFRDMLQSYGPMYVGMKWDKSGGGHARLLVGMDSDGAYDGSDTTMYLHDPWPDTAGKIKMSFGDFVALYEGRATSSNGVVDVQILHAASLPANRAPVMAAPFALAAAQGTQRMAVRALSDGGSDYAVALIPQPNKNACWAAAMAMLLSFRRQQSITPETLAQEVGRSLESSYGWDALSAVRDHYGFVTIAQPSNTSLYVSPQQWAQWLAQHGPLWVVIVGAPHAVVLAGIKGDLSSPDSVKVKLLNPWDTRVDFDDDEIAFNPANNGYSDWLPFSQFASEFGNMAESNYGRWRVLHLPATVATAKGLGARTLAARGSRLPAPPPPVRAMSTGEVNGARYIGGAPGETPVEPSRVPGTTMRTLRGSAERVSWELDQLDGFKHASPDPMIVATPTDTLIELNQWPRLGNDPPALPLSVSFGSGAKAVGNVRIAAGKPPALPYDVRVVARIQDDTSIEASSSGVACIEVVIDVFFTGTVEGDRCARTRLRLRGDGRYDSVADWVARAA